MIITGTQTAEAGDALTNLAMNALARSHVFGAPCTYADKARIFPTSMLTAVRRSECKDVVDQWIARTIGFQAAMQAFDGHPEQALLISQTGALYCEALAAMTERGAGEALKMS